MKKQYLCTLLALLLLISKGFAQQPGDAYVFPIQPGTEAWKKLQSNQEMVDACQLPAATLKSMSTEGLAKTCLSYPLLSRIYAYNDLQTGFDAVARQFNGLQELLVRKDAGKEILKIYRKLQPEALRLDWSLLEQGRFVHQFAYTEVLLAQYVIQGNLSAAEKKGLVHESLEKFKGKEKYPQTFGGSGALISAWVMGRALEKETNLKAYQKANTAANHPMRVFLNNAIVADTQVINQVVLDAQTYLR